MNGKGTFPRNDKCFSIIGPKYSNKKSYYMNPDLVDFRNTLKKFQDNIFYDEGIFIYRRNKGFSTMNSTNKTVTNNLQL